MALLEDVEAREEEIRMLRRAEAERGEALRMAISKRDAALRYISLQERQLHESRASLAAGQPAAQVHTHPPSSPKHPPPSAPVQELANLLHRMAPCTSSLLSRLKAGAQCVGCLECARG